MKKKKKKKRKNEAFASRFGELTTRNHRKQQKLIPLNE